jgi:hypothetical protein
MEGNAATTPVAPSSATILQTRRGRWLLIVAVIFAAIGSLSLGYWYFYAR